MSKRVKESMVEEATRKITGMQDCFVVDYSGTDAL